MQADKTICCKKIMFTICKRNNINITQINNMIKKQFLFSRYVQHKDIKLTSGSTE